MTFTIPARRVRDARAVFRRLAGPRAGSATHVSFVSGPSGLSLVAGRVGVSAEHRLPGTFPPTAFALPLDALPDVGRGDVAFTPDGNEVEVAWTEKGVPRSRRHPATTADAAAPPPLPADLRRQPEGFLKALAEAAATTDPDSVRYALGCLRLRGGSGGAGQVAATDGLQLLVQSGFDFPWDGDRLVPASKLFAARELDADAAVEVGGTADEVLVRVGDWTLRLTVDTAGRFPAVDAHVPAVGVEAGAVELSETDRRFLTDALAALPGTDGEHSPVTLDLNGRVLVRAKGPGDPRPTELVLSSSRWTGPAMTVGTRRGPLLRALRLGFDRVNVYGREAPAVCRDGRRAFVWAVLGKDAAVPASEDAVRVESVTPRTSPGTSPRSQPKRGLAGADAELLRPRDPEAGSEAGTGVGDVERSADPAVRSERLERLLGELVAEARGLSDVLRRRRPPAAGGAAGREIEVSVPGPRSARVAKVVR